MTVLSNDSLSHSESSFAKSLEGISLSERKYEMNFMLKIFSYLKKKNVLVKIKKKMN